MYQVKAFVNGRQVADWRMAHILPLGGTVRLENNELTVVKHIVWCWDEDHKADMCRVNIELTPVETMQKRSRRKVDK